MEKNKEEKIECFFCHRLFFSDDPEFDVKQRICSACAEELDRDNPYSAYTHYGETNEKDA